MELMQATPAPVLPASASLDASRGSRRQENAGALCRIRLRLGLRRDEMGG